MPKYKVVNKRSIDFEKECQKLIDEGYRPCSGIAIYERKEATYGSTGNYLEHIPVNYFVQSFMNNTDKES